MFSVAGELRNMESLGPGNGSRYETGLIVCIIKILARKNSEDTSKEEKTPEKDVDSRLVAGS